MDHWRNQTGNKEYLQTNEMEPYAKPLNTIEAALHGKFIKAYLRKQEGNQAI